VASKRARKKVFALRVFDVEERKLKRIAAAKGFATPTAYLRDLIKREAEALDKRAESTHSIDHAAAA